MNYKLVAYNQDLIEAVYSELINQECDFSKNIVVFPNRRAAHFLKKCIFDSLKTSFIPPQIFAIDDFINYIFGLVDDKKTEDIAFIDSIALLYNMNKKLNFVNVDSFDKFVNVGFRFLKDLEELKIEKISNDRLKESDFIIDTPENIQKNLVSLSNLYQTFYEELVKYNLATRSVKYDVASESYTNDLLSDRKIILAGFFALTKSEQMLFNKILSDDKNMILISEGSEINEQSNKLNIEFNIKSQNYPNIDNINLYQCSEEHSQILSLAKLLDNQACFDEKSVIVLPSSDMLFPFINFCLPVIKNEHFNISLGYPFFRTPISLFFVKLLELFKNEDNGKFLTTNYIDFLSHQFFAKLFSSDREGEVSLKEFLKYWENKEFVTLENLETYKKMGTNFNQNIKLINDFVVRKFINLKNSYDFSANILEVIEFLKSHCEIQNTPFFSEFYQSFIDKIIELKQAKFFKDMHFDSTKGYFVFLRNYIKNISAPFDGTPLKGLQVLGFLETRNITFDNVFILDVNEDILPENNTNETVIPMATKLKLGLPTYKDGEKIYNYYFENIVNRAKNVHLFYVSNDKKIRSRFIEKIVWQKQKAINENELDNSFITNINLNFKFSSKEITEVKKTKEIVDYLKNKEFSATALDTYLDCQLKFYYKYVLNVNKPKQLAKLDNAEVGTIVHKILQNYFSRFLKKKISKDILNENDIVGVIKSEFQTKYGENIFGEKYFIQMQVIKHLKKIISEYFKEKYFDSFIVDALELELNAKFGNYKIHGIIDRVDIAGGKIIIIDYKTGYKESDKLINFEKLDLFNRDSFKSSIGSLQLPFYAFLYSLSQNVAIKDISPMFLMIGKKYIDENIEAKLFNEEDDVMLKYEVLKKLILILLDEITDIEKDFKPPQNKSKSCTYCDYADICGVQLKR